MRKDYFRKCVVVGIIFLFVGAGVVPSISSESWQTKTIYGETQEASSINVGTIIVDDEGDGNTTTIQGAINIADEGGIIKVYSGTYIENVVVNKQLTIIGIDEELGSGDDIGKPIIDGRGIGDVVHISTDDVVISGFIIQNSGRAGSWIDGDAGIEIKSNNNRIENNTIQDNGYGLFPNSCRNCVITNNYFVQNKWEGIYMYASYDNLIVNNIFLENGIAVYDSFDNNITGNTINGKSLVYLENEAEINVTNAGQVILVSCENITVQNLTISETTLAIELWNSNNCKIINNEIRNNAWNGIFFCNSSNNEINQNEICSNNGYGIFVYSNENKDYSSDNNKIWGNNFSQNFGGIVILEPNKNNIFFHNNFILNEFNAEDSTVLGTNKWNYNGEGNFWDDNWYKKDDNNDGISDIPYYIKYTGIDFYPLCWPTFGTFERIPPDMEIWVPKINFLHFGDNDPEISTAITTIIAFPWMNPFEFKVLAEDESGIGGVFVFFGNISINDIQDFLKNERIELKSVFDVYKGRLNKWLFGIQTLTFVAFDRWANPNVKTIDILFIYFPRPTIFG